MKRTFLFAASLIFVVIISMTIKANAGPFMEGNRGHGFGGPGNGVMRAVMQLDLSQNQKQSIYNILQKYREKQHATQVSIMEHKQKFLDQTSDGNFDEDSIRQAFQESVPAIEEAFVLRAKIKSEIYDVLTSEQLAELDQLRTENVYRRQGKKHNEFRRAMLETWLTMDSK